MRSATTPSGRWAPNAARRPSERLATESARLVGLNGVCYPVVGRINTATDAITHVATVLGGDDIAVGAGAVRVSSDLTRTATDINAATGKPIPRPIVVTRKDTVAGLFAALTSSRGALCLLDTVHYQLVKIGVGQRRLDFGVPIAGTPIGVTV